MEVVMKALYPPEGGRPRAFMCCADSVAHAQRGDRFRIACGAVTRTQKGMWTHLRVVHKMKKQAGFVFECEVPLVEPVLPSPDQAKRQAAQGNTIS